MSEQQLAVQEPKAPVLAGNRGLQLASIESMYRFARMACNSGIYNDLGSPEVAMIKIQAGAELGLTPVWALTNIFVVNGKPTVYGDALMGIVRGHPACDDVVETIEGEGERMVATCEVKRKGCVPVVRRFSFADAKTAKLCNKPGPWTMYPQRMLAMRARSWACRDAFADALRGIGVREELQDVQPRQATARVVSTQMRIGDEPEPEQLKAPPEGEEATDLYPERDAQDMKHADKDFDF